MPITTSHNDRKERLSIAFVTAVAASAGCQIAELKIDKESVDAFIRPISGLKAQVNLQLKATSADVTNGQNVEFDVPIKNYDDLRDAMEINPTYLVVLHLPGSLSHWLQMSPTELLIQGCAYYGNLYNLPAVSNETAKRVKWPISQRFTVESLVEMLENAPNRIGTASV